MKQIPIIKPILSIFCGGVFLMSSHAAFAQNLNFDDITWTKENSIPIEEVESTGNGNVANEDLSSIASSDGPFSFALENAEEGGETDRQEYKMFRRAGYHSMIGTFSISADTNFDGGVSIAQTHDDGTGSDGVFSIYQINTLGTSDDLFFGLQTDESDSVDDFPTVLIRPETDYYVDIQTYSDGSNSFERARLWEGTSSNGTLLETWIVNDGSGDRGEGEDADSQYKKIGSYMLSSTNVADFGVTWDNVEFYTGVEN